MTRISSLLVASAVAVLPISAFAQQPGPPAKVAEPTGMSATAPNATGTKTTENIAKPDVKVPAGTKGEVHGTNTANRHHTKPSAPAKTTEPTKS